MALEKRTLEARIVGVFTAGFAAAAILCLLTPAAAFGQNCATHTLRVIAQDSSTNPLPGAKVRIETASLPAQERATDNHGIAEFDNLSCGSWTVHAVKEGFHQLRADPFQVTGGDSGELELTLEPLVVRASIDVHDVAPALTESSSPSEPLHVEDVKELPSRPVTVTDALPLAPGVTNQGGEIKIDGTGEHRSAFVVNSVDVTDPATGRFGQTIPIDSVQTVQVLNTPFMAQYGNFTSGVVAVETRRGGDSWHAELNDPLPEFRIRSWHLRGFKYVTPRTVFSGPLIHQRLYIISAVQYSLLKKPERTLPFPFNESKQESVNSLTQLDYIASPTQLLTASLHISPQHTNFVNPEYFNPQPVTPGYGQHNYVGTLADRLSVGGGILNSTVSIQRFDAQVGAQGSLDMILTPVGNRGNYFAGQQREAGRMQWVEIWSPAQLEGWGRHEPKFGASLTYLDNTGELTERPIDILDVTGLLLRKITFSGGSAYRVTDSEVTAFAQDHWALGPRLAFDLGGRVERQKIAGSVRLAPRTGFSWVPFSNGKTVIHGGFGLFFDRVPLSVYTFAANPQRIVTTYSPDGTIAGDPVNNANVLGPGGVSSAWVYGRHMPGSFAPHANTWNLQLEHRVSAWFRIRASYTDSRSAGLVVLEPQAVETDQLLLKGGGRSTYRQAEVTGRFEWKQGQQLFLTYTRGRAQGSLNDFSGFLGNFPAPLVHQGYYSHLPADLPNRILAWGRANLPDGLQLMPMVEYHTGFPYARLDPLQDYVGTPFGDGLRFPNYLAVDARILKDVKVNTKYTLRFSVSGFNLTNHFNALGVHANTGDPFYGAFFGTYIRRYRADFDVLF